VNVDNAHIETRNRNPRIETLSGMWYSCSLVYSRHFSAETKSLHRSPLETQHVLCVTKFSYSVY